MSIFGGDDDTQEYLNAAQQAFGNIQAPTAAQLQVNDIPLESVQGTINPEQVNAVTEDPNQVSQVALDNGSTQDQENAIQGEQSIANEGGLDANAQLGINEATQQANSNLAGNLGAIMQNAQSTGNGNSGTVLAERLQAAQGSANNLQSQDLQAAQEAESNRETALSNLGTMGSNLTAQQLAASQTNAAANNAATTQNIATKNAANNTNVANNLAGQTANLTNAQNVNAANATAGQTEAYYNSQGVQNSFNDQIAKATGQAGVSQAQSQAAQQNNALNGQELGTFIGAAGKAVASAAKGGVAVPKLTLEQFMSRKKGLIPGKEKVPGNSLKNDDVPAMLSAGEVVIPKDVPKDTEHIKQFMKNAPVAGTNKKVNLEDFFSKKGGK